MSLKIDVFSFNSILVFKLANLQPFYLYSMCYEEQQFINQQFEKSEIAFRYNMKISRKPITARLKHLNMLALALCFAHAVSAQSTESSSTWTDYYTSIKQRTFTTGVYFWQGKTMNLYERDNRDLGYVDRYSDRSQWCNSDLFLAGFTLLGEPFLGVCLLLLTLWLFIGLTTITNIMMEAVHEITAATDSQAVKDENGKEMVIQVPSWNSYIAQITIVAIAGALPEIFFCYFSYFGEAAGYGTTTPSELGPMVLCGSAAVNLLVICGLVICSIGTPTSIKRVGVFAVLAAFSTFAYLWLFLVVRFLTPAHVQFTEAIFTLLFYPLMLLFVWLTDHCTRDKVPQEEIQKKYQRYLCKHMLIEIARQRSKEYVINMGGGLLPPDGTYEEMDRIRTYYKLYFGQDDLRQISLEQLMDVLEPESVVDRMNIRKNVSLVGRPDSSPFCKIHASEFHGDVDKLAENYSPIAFRSSHYDVAENAGEVRLIVEKKIPGDFTFKVITQDGTAKSGFDYEGLSQIMTMHGQEMEREIIIQITEDKHAELDEDFTVILLDEYFGTQLPGKNSSAIVTIIDDDTPGYIGFEDAIVTATPEQTRLKVTLRRDGGTAGDATVNVSTSIRSKLLDKFQVAHNTIDFDSLYHKQVVFTSCQKQSTFEVYMPSSSFKDEKGIIPKKADPIAFVLELTDPRPGGPRGVSLSKRRECLVKIQPDTEAWRKYDLRLEILRYYLELRNPSYFDQFRLACCLSPSIDEVDAIEEVSFWKALAHFLALPWKVVFAIVPPRRSGGGWIPFIISAGLVCCMVYLIMEVIRNMGCFLNIVPVVQALVIVAICCSVPEMVTSFRGVTSGAIDDAADILNPILASNAVNVFVGLGLPWTIRTIYDWSEVDSNTYLGIQESGRIAWQSFTFLIISVLALLCFGCRRFFCFYELGGKCAGICTMFFFFLWALFVLVNVVNVYSVDMSLMQPSQSETKIAASVQLVDLSMCPDQMPAPTLMESSGDNAYVSVDFQLPPDQVEYISEVQVQFAFQGSNKWEDITRDCIGYHDPQETQNCFIEHEAFRWNTESTSCEPVQIRVRACTDSLDQCCGPSSGRWSDASTQFVRVQGPPPKYGLKLDGEATKTSVNVCWPPQTKIACDEFVWYQLEKKRQGSLDFEGSVSNSPWRDVYDRDTKKTQTCHEVRGLEECTDYLFRGRTITQAYEGKFSEYLPVKTACDNCNPGPVITRKKRCMFTIDWGRCFQCEGHDHSIHDHRGRYKVQVRNGNHNWVELTECAQFPGQKQCSLRMEALKKYNLYAGQEIIVKVAPESSNKFSQRSKNRVLFVSQPAVVEGLRLAKQDSNSATVKWNSGTADITSYQIFFRENVSSEWQEFRKIFNGEKNSQRLSGLTAGQTYQFMMRASNQCGQSEPSEYVQVILDELSECHHGNCGPAKKTSCHVDVKVVDCDLEVTLHSSKSIQKLEVEVQGSDYQFHSQNLQCVGGAGRADDKTRICMIPFKTLQTTPFMLRGGDLILVRARTTSKSGWSAWSKTTKKSVITMIAPRRPSPPELEKWEDEFQTQALITFQQGFDNDMFRQNVEYRVAVSKWSGEKLIDSTTVTTKTTRFRLDIEHGYTYKMRVTSMHDCGNSPASEEFCLETPPPKVDPSVDCSGQCYTKNLMHFINRDPDVTGFELALGRQGNNVDFHRYFNCDITDGDTCVIQQKQLVEEPYQMKMGDTIIGSLRTKNNIGFSQPQEIICGNLMIDPCDLRMPKHQQPNGSTIPIHWDGCNPNIWGDSTEYMLQWDRGEGGMFYDYENRSKQTYRDLAITTVKPLYRFRVRSWNECGWGSYSGILEVPICDKPFMECPIVSVEDCRVHVSWKKPEPSCKLAINEDFTYKMKVQSRDGNWYEFPMGECFDYGDKGDYNDLHHKGSKNRCTIEMSDLSKAPFYLKFGEQIRVTVDAQNDLGWSAPREDCPCFAYMKSAPPKMGPPIVISQHSKSIQMGWQQCNAEDLTHYLLWVMAGSNSWQKIRKEPDQLSHTISVVTGRDYKFRIECVNECGHEPSEPTPVRTPDVPGQPWCRVEYQELCCLKVTWGPDPRMRTNTVDAYQIALNGHTIQHCGQDRGENSCIVKMPSLESEYRVKVGSPINCSVSARNQQGWGKWSTKKESGIKLKSQPPKPAQPYEKSGSRTQTSFTICWRGTNGHVQETFYDLWGNDGVGAYPHAFKEIAKGEINKRVDCFEYRHEPITSRKTYEFVVHSENECGKTPSDLVVIELAGPPGCPACVLAQGDCNLALTWQAPLHDGGNPIITYHVEVMSGSGSWVPVRKTCPQNKCKFSMDELIDQYDLRLGDEVRMKVTPENSEGRGCEAETQPSGIRVIVPPNKLTGLRQKRTPDQISLSWDRCDVGSCTYSLQTQKNGARGGGMIHLEQPSYVKYLSAEDMGCTFNFCVNAENECGKSVQVCTEVKVCAKPDHPMPICKPDGKCGVAVSWFYPDDHGCPISDYRLNIGGTEHTSCSSNSFRRDYECRITMATLKSSYFMVDGSSIALTAQAKNEEGWSDRSFGCDPELFVYSKPPPMTASATLSQDQHTIQVCWSHEIQQRASTDLYYVLTWNEGYPNTQSNKELTTTPNSCYPVAVPLSLQGENRNHYKFKIMAHNQCGYTEALAETRVEYPPDCPTCVISLMDNCGLLVRWAEPFNGFSAITSYKLEIETSSFGRFSAYKCNGSALECIINMDNLRRYPFNLRTGDEINVRMKACNKVGCSTWSPAPKTRVYVVGTPPAMMKPKATLSNPTSAFAVSGSFTVCWQNMFFQNMGQTALLPGNKGAFELAWGTTSAAPGDPSPVSGMTARKTLTETCYKQKLDPSAEFYRFVVRARNACGPGAWSDTETVFVPNVDPCSDPTKPCNHHPNHYRQNAQEFEGINTTPSPQPVENDPVADQFQSNNNNAGFNADSSASSSFPSSSSGSSFQSGSTSGFQSGNQPSGFQSGSAPSSYQRGNTVSSFQSGNAPGADFYNPNPPPSAPAPSYAGSTSFSNTGSQPQIPSRCVNPLHPSQSCTPCWSPDRNRSQPCSVNCKCAQGNNAGYANPGSTSTPSSDHSHYNDGTGNNYLGASGPGKAQTATASTAFNRGSSTTSSITRKPFGRIQPSTLNQSSGYARGQGSAAHVIHKPANAFQDGYDNEFLLTGPQKNHTPFNSNEQSSRGTSWRQTQGGSYQRP